MQRKECKILHSVMGNLQPVFERRSCKVQKSRALSEGWSIALRSVVDFTRISSSEAPILKAYGSHIGLVHCPLPSMANVGYRAPHSQARAETYRLRKQTHTFGDERIMNLSRPLTPY